MRIYITSRNRTPSSASPSDFRFAFERPIELPEGVRGYIDSFTCSSTWETVLGGVNAKLYCKWSGGVQRIATLEAGDVQNATALAAKVASAIANLSGPHTVNVTAVGNRLKFGERYIHRLCATTALERFGAVHKTTRWISGRLWADCYSPDGESTVIASVITGTPSPAIS